MNKYRWSQVLSLVIIMGFFFILNACSKDDEVIPDPDPTVQIDEIDEFIWSGLKDYYLWVDNVSNLTNPAFSDRTALANFLSPYTDHEDLFEDLLYQRDIIDKWSWIVDDYVALENYFQGITLSMGYEFGLVRITGTDDIYGFIRYVIPDTPADIGGLVRGEIFNKIDDQTLNMDNYRDLLFEQNSYKISFANFVGDELISNAKEVNLLAVEVHENPIHLSKTFEVNGKKVGYLVYNGFTSTYDTQLNDAFGSLLAEGVEELILDFRYNGGGSIQTSAYLASMIYGTHTNEIFTKARYNDLIQAELTEAYGSDYFNWMFEENIKKDVDTYPINSLDLTKVYILTSGNSASASELVINGLMPYMDVVLVGTNTHGKYVGSITLKDYIDNNGTVNPNHTWAMQPIVLKLENASSVSDYVNGFTPDVILSEGYRNLVALGDENEPLLKAALDHIRGISTPKTFIEFEPKEIGSSRSKYPYSKEMYIDFEKMK